jgi:predicted nucleotidyltransferase
MPTPPPDTDTVRARLAALLPALREQYGVRALSLFGSYARREQTDESDLDVLVDFDETPNLYEFVGLGLDIEEALGMRVDLVMREGLKPRVAPSVLRDLMPV